VEAQLGQNDPDLGQAEEKATGHLLHFLFVEGAHGHLQKGLMRLHLPMIQSKETGNKVQAKYMSCYLFVCEFSVSRYKKNTKGIKPWVLGSALRACAGPAR
jgi:hypothetical protein